MLSEKRFLFLSNNGGFYQSYHFVPVGEEFNVFGLGDNQLGAELSGHSVNSYTRYGVALLSSNDGTPELPTSRSYDTYLTFSQAFPVGKLGVQRFGGVAHLGREANIAFTSNGNAIPGARYGDQIILPVRFSCVL